jgi:uncharacterized membrane protein
MSDGLAGRGPGYREAVTPRDPNPPDSHTADPHTAGPTAPARVPAPVSALSRRGPAPRPSVWRGLLRGAAAGAAGTTTLNTVTYLDMALRGRPASDAPERLVGRLADEAGVALPGNRTQRRNRLAALGPLSGIGTGVGLGALAGVLRGAGVRLPTAVGGPLLGLAAMVASDAPMAVLGVSDPRTWSTVDWVGDVVPHLAYGFATHATLKAATEAEEERVPVAPAPPSVLLRAVALGAASGSRSTAGVTAVALTSARGDRGPLASGLGSRAGTLTSGVLAAGELVADKLPATPSRLAPPALGGRLLLGGTSAAAVARREGHDPVLPALVGAAGALGMSVLGSRLRGLAAQRFGSDRPGAFVEDGLAAALGWLGARRPTA